MEYASVCKVGKVALLLGNAMEGVSDNGGGRHMYMCIVAQSLGH